MTDREDSAERFGWRYWGQERPPFALSPAPNQESVWDYPRPPRLVADTRRVSVSIAGIPIAETSAAVRVLETASPPTFYVPASDVHPGRLVPEQGTSFCEWKGHAVYWAVVAQGIRVSKAGWSYPQPAAPFEALRDFVCFYPDKVVCTVDGELVRAQPGGYYGGWLTSEIVGPVKGVPGSSGW